MENLLHDIVAHNLQNRTVALIENGSWAPTSGKHMRDLLGKLKNVTILDQQLTLRSAMAESQSAQLGALADALCATLPQPQVHASEPGTVDNQAMFVLRPVRPERPRGGTRQCLHHQHGRAGHGYAQAHLHHGQQAEPDA